MGEVDRERRRHLHRVIWLFPVYWIVATSLKKTGRYRQSGANVPLLRPDAG